MKFVRRFLSVIWVCWKGIDCEPYIPTLSNTVRFAIILSLLLSPLFAKAQYIIYPGTLWLLDQGDIDSLQIRYGAVEAVAGSLAIGDFNVNDPNWTGSDITNLNGLSTLRLVGGGLFIYGNPHLKNLDGLSHLDSIYGDELRVKYNDSLSNMEALGSIRFFQENTLIDFFKNRSLRNLKGLEGMRSALSINIENCDSLQSLKGLDSLQALYGLIALRFNYSLQSMDGLNRLERSTDPYNTSINIENCANLRNMDALQRLSINEGESVGLSLKDNPRLQNIDGLLQFSMDKPRLSNLQILNCDSLDNVDGLSNFEYVSTQFQIEGNDLLRNLNGLQKVDSINARAIISDNARLRYLGLDSLRFARSLTISGNPSLQNLQALSHLESTFSDVALSIIDNDSLTDLHGLHNLRQCGGIDISGNQRLRNIDALSKIDTLRSAFYAFDDSEIALNISDNESLENLDGLRNLRYAHCSLVINNNDKLEKIDSFQHLNHINWSLLITSNDKLKSVHAFENLHKIGWWLNIYNNAVLTDISGLSNLDTIGALSPNYNSGELSIGGRQHLKDLSPLQNLKYIGNGVTIYLSDSLESLAGLNNVDYIYKLQVWGNSGLKGIDAFYNVKSLPTNWQHSFIKDNPALLHLDGLQNIVSIQDSLVIAGNPALEDCSALCEIKKHVPANTLRVRDNPVPCNSLPALSTWCATLSLTEAPTEQTSPKAPLHIFPNPSDGNSAVMIELEGCGEGRVSVYDVLGTQLHNGVMVKGQYVFEMSSWNAGFYCVLIECNGQRWAQWLVQE